MTLEKNIQKACNAYLRARNIPFIHLSVKAREAKGWPDLTFFVNGNAYAVELKTKTGRLSDEQKKELLRLQLNGVFCYVCRSFDEFIAAINQKIPQYNPNEER